MIPMVKYPRTQHVEGSRFQAGDEDLEAVPFASLRGLPFVVEEKVDGANAAISLDEDGSLLLQSRGHYLRGGARERHFAPLKAWAASHQERFRAQLGSRYVVYGEWVYAKHTVFYDALPHYFLEFDVLDRQTGRFLDTPGRAGLLRGLPVVSVPVLWAGRPKRLDDLTGLVGPSRYKTPAWRDHLADSAREVSRDLDTILRETDPSDHAEGLYLKHEEDGEVLGRYKWVRAGFLSAVVESGSHWLARPIVPNRLAPGVDLFRP